VHVLNDEDNSNDTKSIFTSQIFPKILMEKKVGNQTIIKCC